MEINGASEAETSPILEALRAQGKSDVDSTARGITGARSRSSGKFSATGDAQTRNFVQRQATTSATPAYLSADAAAVGAANAVILPDNSAVAFTGRVIARSTGGDAAAWTFSGLIKRGSGVASTAFVGSPAVTSLAADSGASSWALAVEADTTNGAFVIKGTGAASTTIRWVAVIDSLEVL